MHRSLPQYREPDDLAYRIRVRARRRTTVRAGAAVAGLVAASLVAAPAVSSLFPRDAGTSPVPPASAPTPAPPKSTQIPGIGVAFPVADGTVAGKPWTMYSSSKGSSPSREFGRCLYGHDDVLTTFVCYTLNGRPVAYTDDTIDTKTGPSNVRAVQGITDPRVTRVRIDLAEGAPVYAPTVVTPNASDVRFFAAVTGTARIAGVQGLDATGAPVGRRMTADTGDATTHCTRIGITRGAPAILNGQESQVCPAEEVPQHT